MAGIGVSLALLVLRVISGEMKVVDLTWSQGPGAAVYWPGNPSMNFTILYRGNTTGNYWYESNWFSTAEHGGTHLDSPAHFFEGGWRVHEIPPHRLVGPGVVIDVKAKAKSNPDYRVVKSDFTAYETKYGQIPKGAIVLMNSGWGFKYPNANEVFSSGQPDTPSTFHFPGYHEDAITWLLTNRNVSMIGVDTPSIDYGQSTEFNVHRVAGSFNLIGLENVANLDDIPESGATIVVGVIKLVDGSGGPARILAMYDNEAKCDGTSGSAVITGLMLTNLLTLVYLLLAF